MEKLVEMGLVKSIGMSNMNIPKIESVWQEMKIKPVVNECELHPHLRQDELIAYLKKRMFCLLHIRRSAALTGQSAIVLQKIPIAFRIQQS